MYIAVNVKTKLEAPRLKMSAFEKSINHDCLLDFIRYLWIWIKNKDLHGIINYSVPFQRRCVLYNNKIYG